MKLMSLKIDNFKGIGSLELTPEGKNISIYAENGLGKTTIFDAIQWLLFGKDSLGRAQFEIKPYGTHGQDLYTEVEAEFDTPFKLKRSYYEKFTTKRGEAKSVFSGHTTDYFIDDVPVQEKEYMECIKQIADEKTFRLLTDPRYFNEQLHWEERRKYLVEWCGDVSDEDVFEADDKLAELPGVIGKHTIDEYKEIAKSRRTKIKDELKAIPVRIDEAAKSKSVPENSMATAKTMIKSHEKTIATKERELNRIENNSETSAKTKELNEIDSKIIAIENDLQKKANDESQRLRKALTDATNALNDAINERDKILRQVDGIEKSASDLKVSLQPLRDRWKSIHDETFEPVAEHSKCPSCGQDIPQEQIDDAYGKALAAFNLDKAQRLEAIDKKGLGIKDAINSLDKEVKGLQSRAEEYEQKIEDLASKADAAKITHDNMKEPVPPAELAELKSKKENMQIEISELETNSAPAIEKLTARIDEVKARIKELNAEVTQHEHNAKMDKRIDELKATEEALAAEYEELERHILLIEEFTRAKCAMLDERINGKFKTCRFSLFQEQVNGGIKDVCEVTVDGVPYWSINNACRIQMGAEIIRVAQEFYGLTPPVVFDNRESVLELPAMTCQTISLYVSEGDNELRIEYDKK